MIQPVFCPVHQIEHVGESCVIDPAPAELPLRDRYVWLTARMLGTIKVSIEVHRAVLLDAMELAEIQGNERDVRYYATSLEWTEEVLQAINSGECVERKER